MLFVLKLLIAGWVVLLIAMAANAMATWLKLLTWYGFIENMQQRGIAAFGEAGAINLLWLFMVYPFILGTSAWLGIYLLRNWN